MHSGYLGDSVVGPNVRIGAGFVNANKRLDRRSIGVMVKGKVVDSGLTQLGALIGEGAKIGVHVSIMPGKCIGPRSVVYPHQSVERNIIESLETK
jgi:bifunctional UDP-N-acetylglucosamine pyrophosphorylase/glucosamine-1-phosphate N-acetyltransferase